MRHHHQGLGLQTGGDTSSSLMIPPGWGEGERILPRRYGTRALNDLFDQENAAAERQNAPRDDALDRAMWRARETPVRGGRLGYQAGGSPAQQSADMDTGWSMDEPLAKTFWRHFTAPDTSEPVDPYGTAYLARRAKALADIHEEMPPTALPPADLGKPLPPMIVAQPSVTSGLGMSPPSARNAGSLAPGFERDPDTGQLTKNGRPPDTYISTQLPGGGGYGAIPAWREGRDVGSQVPLPPVLQPIAKRESNLDYRAQNPTSSASGALQDVDATWREATRALGYGDQWAHAKDAPPDVQNAANIWLHGRYGTKPWAASEPGMRMNPGMIYAPRHEPGVLANPGFHLAPSSGDNVNGGLGTPSPSGPGLGSQPPTGRKEDVVPSSYKPYEPGIGASPWLALMAAGFGTAAGRSPYPLVNLGAGGLQAVKVLEGQEQERAKAYQAEQTGRYQTGELATRNRQITAEEAHWQNQFDAENKRFQIQWKQAITAEEKADVMQKHYENMDAINAGWRAFQMGKPLSYYDPKTGQAGSATWDPKTESYNIPEGSVIGKPSATAGQFTAKRQAWLQVHPGDEAGALEYANGRRSMSPAEFGRLVLTEESRLSNEWLGNPNNIGKTPPNFRYQAEQSMRQLLGETVPVELRQPASPQPQQQRPPTAPAAAPPTMPVRPPWATGEGHVNPATGQVVYPEGNRWFNPDHTPYAPPAASAAP
jgi:hypothetical protein